MFGLAHVDTPKGDLDMSGNIAGPTTTVAENSAAYPYGTTEMFPQMEDSSHNLLSNSAHYYMECSNKGTCVRTTGVCTCYDGYEGVACQRASCPGTPVPCSGNGVCRTIKQLANDYYGNTYELWDKSSTMGCQCDAGFYGPDCSLRKCKNGVDPLYLDDSSTVKYPVFNVAQFTSISATSGTDTISTLFNDGTPLAGTGYWALRFYDHHGQGWLTNAIAIDATCPQVVAALEALPNNVIPKGHTKCVKVSAVNALEQSGFSTVNSTSQLLPYDKTGNGKNNYYMMFKMALWDMQLPANAIETDTYNLQIQNSLYSSGSTETVDSAGTADLPTTAYVSGVIYRLHFNGNPGALREPEIEIYLDGKRPSLASSKPTATPTALYGKTSTKVWTDGQQGEDQDYFGNHCDGVTVQITNAAVTISSVPQTIYYLTSFTPTSKALLKSCLGDANLDASDNVEVYNWDYGSAANPHIIKLVRTVSTFMDGGYYAVLWYDTSLCGDSTGTLVSTLCDNLGAAYALASSGSTPVSGYNVVGLFRLLHPFVPPDNAYLGTNEHDSWEIYTTKGTLAVTSEKAEAVFGFGSKYIYTTNTIADSLSDDAAYAASFHGDLSCEAGNSTFVRHCMNVTDIFTMLWWDDNSAGTNPNPRYINLYKANRIYTAQSKNLPSDVENSAPAVIPGTTKSKNPAQYMTHVIESDLSTNWAASAIDQTYNFRIYKFIPTKESTYTYVAECANRGICDTTAGACTCFAGYTSDSCGEQSSLQL